MKNRSSVPGRIFFILLKYSIYPNQFIYSVLAAYLLTKYRAPWDSSFPRSTFSTAFLVSSETVTR